jgi:hypothetical protein
MMFRWALERRIRERVRTEVIRTIGLNERLIERITASVMAEFQEQQSDKIVKESEESQARGHQVADPWTNERYS